MMMLIQMNICSQVIGEVPRESEGIACNRQPVAPATSTIQASIKIQMEGPELRLRDHSRQTPMVVVHPKA
jgi:hypothetical protein